MITQNLFNIPCQYATSTYENTFSSRNKQTNIFLISNGKGVIVKQEKKRKRNETKPAETKRNETKRDTSETKQDKAETKPNETKRDTTETKRNQKNNK